MFQLYEATQCECLKDVDVNLLEEKILDNIVMDSRRAECLEQLVNCTEIIQWLKSETKGQTLIKCALSSVISCAYACLQ